MSIIYKLLNLTEWKTEENLFGLTTSVLVVLASFFIFLKLRRRPGVPPGPPLLPVVGNLVSLASSDILKVFEDLRNKYGDIYSLYIGNELVVVLNGFDVIHDAFVKKGSQFVYRPPSAFQKIIEDPKGILYNNGKQWKEQRIFVQKALQDICLKNSAQHIEEVIQVEVRALIKAIIEKQGDFDVSNYVHHLGLNVMFVVTYGQRFEYGDKEAVHFATTLNDIAQQVAKMQVLSNCFPFLQNLPGDLLGNKRRTYLNDELHLFVRKLGEDNANHNDANSDELTIDDAFKNEINRSEQAHQHESESLIKKENKEYIMIDLIGAGGDTTATAILWIILYLVREPKVQDNVYQEIIEVIGCDKEPCLDDRTHMPYTQAVILEGLRIVATAPIALPHSVQKETPFHGFVIPKDATIIANVTTALNDPSVWDNPKDFNPNRFLGPDKSEVITPKEFIPFSVGPRSCMGETMAKMEMFMTIAGLVQRFELSPASNGDVPGTKGGLGITYRPNPFTMQFQKR